MARAMQCGERMPRRRRRFEPVPPSASAWIRRALRDARDAIVDLGCDRATDRAFAEMLRGATVALEAETRIAIVLVDELDAPPVPLAHAREEALRAALQLNAMLAAAYEDRRASTRAVLVASYAVARLIELVHAIAVPVEPPRWN